MTHTALLCLLLSTDVYTYPMVTKSLDDLINELDALSWTFRIEKASERGCVPHWKVVFVNPKNKTWYERHSESLYDAISEALDILTAPHLAEYS